MFKKRCLVFAAGLSQILLSALNAHVKDYSFEQLFEPHYLCEAESNPTVGLHKRLYESYLKSYSLAEHMIIPKRMHFIWLGSPLPAICAKMVATWKELHPDWIVKVWTDADAEAFPLQNRLAYNIARNYGEKSDIFRYEILYHLGGMYADIDFECLQSFEELHRSCEFYTGALEQYVLNGLVGCRPGHPIIKACMDHIRIGNGDHDSERIMRGSGPYYLSAMIESTLTAEDEGKVVVFPANVFYPFPAIYRFDFIDLEEIKSLFARPESMAIHYWSSTWQRE
ncbi:MAG: glycosyltransferase [Chlamydiota bacterium]